MHVTYINSTIAPVSVLQLSTNTSVVPGMNITPKTGVWARTFISCTSTYMVCVEINQYEYFFKLYEHVHMEYVARPGTECFSRFVYIANF
jgi:hypothetical protein